MQFIKNLIARFSSREKAEPETLRGLAPMQTDAEQSASRSRMEAEMAEQKVDRDSRAEAAKKPPEETQT